MPDSLYPAWPAPRYQVSALSVMATGLKERRSSCRGGHGVGGVEGAAEREGGSSPLQQEAFVQGWCRICQEWPRLARCQEFIAYNTAISNFLYSPRADELAERLRTLAK